MEILIKNKNDTMYELKINETLNPKIWDEWEMYDNVRQSLLKIAKQFYTDSNIDVELKDIILIGSLANYKISLLK